MALEHDFLQRIVNVNWGGGLAVEFTERPDYLTLNHAVSMNKVTISFWFRVPTLAAEAARQATPSVFWDYRVLYGVVPILTWGPQPMTTVSEIKNVDTGAINVSAGIIYTQAITGSHSAPMPMSFIGLRVGSTEDPQNPPTLDVHIQTADHATGNNLKHIGTSFEGEFIGIDIHSGKPIYANVEYTMTDVSHTVTEEPDYLGNSDSNSSNSGAGHPTVTLDKWHHLLMSWELIGHSNHDHGGASKMWCAIDDVNKDGTDLPAMNDIFAGMGPNDHMAWVPWNYFYRDDVTASIAFTPIPSNPLRAPGPASVNYVIDESGGTATKNPIQVVEMAELQIFSGIALDTSVTANRRAFIDFEEGALRPVDPKRAEELIGKRPDILLHGSSKWQQGKNTGSVGTNADGDEIPAGQFTPTGVITKYTPDPSISED